MNKRIIVSFAVLFMTASCSVFNKSNKKPIYTETSGLSLKFKFNNKKDGYLVVKNYTDTIPFKYEVKKNKTKIVDAESLKEINKTIYEYHLHYTTDKHKDYKILDDKFMVLYSLEKRRVIEYESHR